MCELTHEIMEVMVVKDRMARNYFKYISNLMTKNVIDSAEFIMAILFLNPQ